MAPRLPLEIGHVDLVRGAVYRDDGGEVQLTTKEREVLAYLAARPGEVVDRDALLTDVWGHARPAVTRAVDHTVRRLRSKIEVNSSDPQHILTEHGAGYRFVPHADPTRATVHEPVVRAQRDVFVGRASELEALQDTVAASRCVTVLGPGGMGKTRLVRRWMPGSAYFVDLAEVRSAAGLDAAVAACLNVDEADLVHALAAAPRIVVLDNLEQIADVAGQRIDAWLAAASQLRIVGTSRARLRVPGERLLELGGLAEEDAVALFVERARAVGGADLDEPTVRTTIARLTRRLDGLPLAIELAAARAGILGPEDLLDRLEDRFAALATNPEAHPRHRALDAAISWSWELLGPDDQVALVGCAVFRGGMELDAAEAVIGPQAIERVQTLRDRSLLTRLPGRPGRVRLGVMESIRAFVEDRDPPGIVAARCAHRDFFQRQGRSWTREAAGGPRAWARLLRERSNLLAAHRAAVRGGESDAALDLAEALEPVLAAQGPAAAWREVVQKSTSLAPGVRATGLQARLELAHGRADAAAAVLEATLDAADSSERTPLLGLLGRARRGQRRYDEASALLLQALADEERPRGQAMLKHQLGLVAFDRADWPQARQDLEAALDAFEELGHLAPISRVRLHLGHLAAESGQPEEADRHYVEAASAFASQGDRRGEAIATSHLALVAQELGNREQAWSWSDEALASHTYVGNLRFVAFTHLVRASLAIDDQSWARVRDEATAARRQLQRVGDRRFEGVALARLAVAHAGLGELEAARRLLAEARQALAEHRVLGVGVEVLAGFVDLAAGDRAAAQARLEGGAGQRGSNFVRVAVAQLRRAVSDR